VLLIVFRKKKKKKRPEKSQEKEEGGRDGIHLYQREGKKEDLAAGWNHVSRKKTSGRNRRKGGLVLTWAMEKDGTTKVRRGKMPIVPQPFCFLEGTVEQFSEKGKGYSNQRKVNRKKGKKRGERIYFVSGEKKVLRTCKKGGKEHNPNFFGKENKHQVVFSVDVAKKKTEQVGGRKRWERESCNVFRSGKRGGGVKVFSSRRRPARGKHVRTGMLRTRRGKRGDSVLSILPLIGKKKGKKGGRFGNR